MSLEKKVKEFAERARQILLAQAAEDRENKEGKGTWKGYGTDGRGRVKKDGETKPVDMIGEISLPTDADVFLDSTDSIEFQKATPKTSPNIPESKVTTKIDPPVTKNRSPFIDEGFPDPGAGLPPYFLFIVFNYQPNFRNVFDSSASAFRRSWIEPPSGRVRFRIEQQMFDEDKGIAGTFVDDSLFGLNFMPRDVNGNITTMSNPNSWLGFPVFEPQPDSRHCDLVWYSTRYTQPWIDAGRSDLVDKALLALRHITTQQLSLQLGGEQSDLNYLINSTHKLYPREFVPYYGGPGTPAQVGDTSGFAIRDISDFWEPAPTNVQCPDFTVVNPGYDAATCYFWGDTVEDPVNPPAGKLDFQVSVHGLYLPNLREGDENSWRWAFSFPSFSGINIISGFPSLVVGTCFSSLGHRLFIGNSYTGFKGMPSPGADQFTLSSYCPLEIESTDFTFGFNFP